MDGPDQWGSLHIYLAGHVTNTTRNLRPSRCPGDAQFQRLLGLPPQTRRNQDDANTRNTKCPRLIWSFRGGNGCGDSKEGRTVVDLGRRCSSAIVRGIGVCHELQEFSKCTFSNSLQPRSRPRDTQPSMTVIYPRRMVSEPASTKHIRQLGDGNMLRLQPG